MNKREFKKWFKRNNMDLLYRSGYKLLTMDFFRLAHIKFPNIPGNNHRKFAYLYKRPEMEAYYSEEQMKSNQKGATRFLEKNFSKRLFRDSLGTRKQCDIFVQKYHIIENDLREYPSSDLLKLYLEFQKVYIRLLAYFRSSRPEVVDSLVGILKNELKKKSLGNMDVERAVRYLTTPFNTNDPIKKEMSDWISILKRKLNRETLERHVKKYAWLFMNTYSFDEAIQYLNSRYNKEKNKLGELKNDVEKLRKEERMARNQRKKILAKVKSRKIKDLSGIIIAHAEERLLIKTCWMGIEFICRKLLGIISKIAELQTEEFMEGYTHDEIINLLKSDKIISKTEIRKRRNSYALITDGAKNCILTGKSWFSEISISSEDKEIKGSSAFPGKVIGIVKMIPILDIKSLGKNINSFKKGQILVTPMTQPNILPLIAKASAIVTEQGGLTSHAAIISREFKIPCIVGAKMVTKILKDGDLVEVDADKGVVKVIRRK